QACTPCRGVRTLRLRASAALLRVRGQRGAPEPGAAGPSGSTPDRDLRSGDPHQPPGRSRRRGRSADPGRRRPLRRHRARPALPSPPATGGLTQTRRPGVPSIDQTIPVTGRPRGSEAQMAELTISPEEIRNALDTAVSTYQAGATEREEIGRVSEAADGIARVEGLPGVMANELVRFEDGTLGLAL